MDLYSIALFLHVVGAVLLFAALTVEGIAARLSARSRSADDAGISAATRRLGAVVGPPSAAAILIPGVYMTATRWGWTPWIAVGLATWAVIAAVGAVNGIRTLAIERAAAAERGLVSPHLTARLRDPLPSISWGIRVGMAVGVLFLMTVKPGLIGSVLAIVIGAALGLATSIPALSRARSTESAGA